MADGIIGGDQRFAALLARATEILDSALPTNVTAPIDLPAVLDSFGVGEPLVEVGRGRHGGLRKVGPRWHPVVYRDTPGPSRLSARERFTVAHELAHAILEDSLHLRPVRDAQYWALEGVCDDFASRLLIPEPVVSESRASVRDASSALLWIERLASATETSLAASARRLLRGTAELSAWGIQEISKRPPESTVYQVLWAAGEKRHDLTTRSHVIAANPLFRAIQTIGDEVGNRGEQVVGRATAAFSRRSAGYLLITWWERNGSEDAAADSSSHVGAVNTTKVLSLFE